MLLTDWKTLVQELIYKIVPRERMSGNLTQRDRWNGKRARQRRKREWEECVRGKAVHVCVCVYAWVIYASASILYGFLNSTPATINVVNVEIISIFWWWSGFTRAIPPPRSHPKHSITCAAFTADCTLPLSLTHTGSLHWGWGLHCPCLVSVCVCVLTGDVLRTSKVV